MPPPLEDYDFNSADSQGACTIYRNARDCYQMRCNGSQAWRNNNPGGLPCPTSPPTIPGPGDPIGCVGGMAVYATLADGEAAQEAAGAPDAPWTPGHTSQLICPGHSGHHTGSGGSIDFHGPGVE